MFTKNHLNCKKSSLLKSTGYEMHLNGKFFKKFEEQQNLKRVQKKTLKTILMFIC